MRLTVSLEGNSEGKVLASVDMEEIVKMTITDDIEKSNFNPQMLKVCTDTSYECGYQQGMTDAIEEFAEFVKKDWRITKACVITNEPTDCFGIGGYLVNLLDQFKDDYLEQLKEKKNE